MKLTAFIAVIFLILVLFLGCGDARPAPEGGPPEGGTFQIAPAIIRHFSEKAIGYATVALICAPILVAGLFIARSYLPIPPGLIRKAVGPILAALVGTIAVASGALFVADYYAWFFVGFGAVLLGLSLWWLKSNLKKIEQWTGLDVYDDEKDKQKPVANPRDRSTWGQQ